MVSSRLCCVRDCGKQILARCLCRAHYRRWKRHGDPLGGSVPRGQTMGSPFRFMMDIALAYKGDECLIWPYTKNEHGRAKIRIHGKSKQVSRIVCENVHGSPPTPEHEAAHSCGKGHLGCISPNHLSWKTPAENQADRLVHGTDTRGEKHGSSKLTEADVREIRILAQSMTQKEIAKLFSVSTGHISDVISMRRWSWLSSSQEANQ